MAAGASLAPPVSVKAGATAQLGVLLALPAVAGMLTLALAWHGLSGVVALALFALLALAAVASALFWRGQRPQRLTWDGGSWLLAGPDEAPDARRHVVRVQVALDLQWALLVRSRASARHPQRRWLWLQRGNDRRRWHALRCALYATPAHG